MFERGIEKFKLSKLFSYENGNTKYTKTWCNLHKGKFEVYSGTTIGHFAFIDKADYKGRYLTFTTDGEKAGTVQIVEGEFSIGSHRTLLVPKNNNINIDYVQFYLREILQNKYKKGNVPSVHWSNIKDEYLVMPITNGNDFDVERQKIVAEKLKQIENQKILLRSKIEYLNDVAVKIPEMNNVAWKELNITDLFIPKNGSSLYTKTWCKKNSGDYPLFSGNTVGAYDYINKYDYDGEYLTWAKDGLAGYMMYHNEKFSITGHRGILIPIAEMNNINLKYLKYLIEPIFREIKKGREGDLGKNEYTTVNSDMIKKIKTKLLIPLKENGEYDLELQNKYIEKYELIENIKKEITEKVNNVLDVNVE